VRGLCSALIVAVLVTSACGGSTESPRVYCENTVGAGDIGEDLLGSWSLNQNAALTTHTFLSDGRLLVHAESDEPGRGPFIDEYPWSLSGETVTVVWSSTNSQAYVFGLDSDGLWQVAQDGANVEWRRCGVNADL